jgi:dihydrodipicolinate synthase/N-acetylneuraminate lyase
MFDPALEGYWGSANLDLAADSCLEIIRSNAAKVDGIKISLLDEQREIDFRSRLPEGVRLYTGDDFNYPSLIRSGSDALLGIFDPIAPAAAAALEALDAGDLDRYEAIFAPTVPLARHLFEAPTSAYKTGIVFLAWLAGHQEHFRMVGGMETARSASHLQRAYELADVAGLLPDREFAKARAAAALPDLIGARP